VTVEVYTLTGASVIFETNILSLKAYVEFAKSNDGVWYRDRFFPYHAIHYFVEREDKS
jgi:hypothetical protein